MPSFSFIIYTCAIGIVCTLTLQICFAIQGTSLAARDVVQGIADRTIDAMPSILTTVGTTLLGSFVTNSIANFPWSRSDPVDFASQAAGDFASQAAGAIFDDTPPPPIPSKSTGVAPMAVTFFMYCFQRLRGGR